MTNFEKIKAMNLAELAEFLDKASNQERDDWSSIGCCGCVHLYNHPKDCGECEWVNGIEAWLRLEV